MLNGRILQVEADGSFFNCEILVSKDVENKVEKTVKVVECNKLIMWDNLLYLDFIFLDFD